MCRKRRHDSANEKEQSSSPLKRCKYVATTAVASRRAEKPKDNPLKDLRCVICASTSTEGLLPIDEQPNLVPRCHQNGRIWMAHRTCGQLLDGVCVFKPFSSEDEIVEGLRSIDRSRFKLKCAACTDTKLRVHGAKIQCSSGTCVVAFHPMCAKQTKGVSLTEVKTVKTTDHDGVRESVEYELWCKFHNPDILAARRAAKIATQHKLYAELETVKPGTTVSHYRTARAYGQAPTEGHVVENDIKGRKMKISDGGISDYYEWDCIVEVVGGMSRNRAESPENLEQVDHENTLTAPNLRTSSTTQENIVQSGVPEALSFASSLASLLPTTSLVHENPDPAPWSLTTSVHQMPLRMVVETGVRSPATARPKSKAKSKPSSTASTSVPTLVPALEPPLPSPAALSSLRCFICASPSVEYLLPLRHQPRWDLGACRHSETYGSWEAHRECALLIDETSVYEPPGCIRGQVENVRSIDPEHFKLKCVGCTRMDFKLHGAKIKCQNPTCVVAYHPDCVKQAEGIMFHEDPISEVKRDAKTRTYTLWCEAHDPDNPRVNEPIENGSCPTRRHYRPGMEIMIKCRGRDEEGVFKTVISNDVAGRRVECKETTGARWYCWSQVIGISSESHEISSSETGADGQQIRGQISTNHDIHDIRTEITDSDRSATPETAQGQAMLSPKPNSFALSDQTGNTCLQGRSQTPDTMLREVLSSMIKTSTSTSQAMHGQPIPQTTAHISPPIISTPNQSLVEVNEQFITVKDEGQLDDDAMELVVTPLEEGGVEEGRALTDANDTDIETRHSTISETETDEEEQFILVPWFERSEPPAVLQGPSVGIQCGTPPKQCVGVGVQTDDTAPRDLSPDVLKDAWKDHLLRMVMQKEEWKPDLDRMLNEVQFEIWRKGWVKGHENAMTIGRCDA